MNNSTEQRDSSLANWPLDFFKQWPKNIDWTRERNRTKIDINTAELTQFFNQLSEPLKLLQHRALSFDPWEVAGLERKEVRNTAVLAWLLDPEGTHGFGRLPLQTLLQTIRHNRNDIPEDYHRYCRVQVETNPTGDCTNRVDIEIDADNFLLFIEVKIDASEQPEQIARYCEDAEYRAMSRPWAVVFLTPQGKESQTLGPKFKPENVPCLSWRQLASCMEDPLQLYYNEFISADSYSPSRQMAAYAVFCFLNRIRQF
ncbi:TPA: PD-(D/E)XK nuclease family protein [Providencia rettgeri]|uniref:PDDEXK-like family protein n=1 Tax=Providencia rettgeri TaxID=587 RepID=UPI0018C84A87|nr:PD-(D/E)XK nuclease family protein [Providencia rettgeri]MBG5924733.1 PD-(D/E)XK nuclease family protein [Providencia rettgeri]HEM8209233.1 PD-(D/E)XK nuclease family protein [Providencia rettgeri]